MNRLCAVAFLCSLSAAGCRDTGALYRDHMKRGRALFEEGKFARAHIAFDRARGLGAGGEDASLWSDLSALAVAANAPELISDTNINELDYAAEYLRGRFPAHDHLLETARGNLLSRAGKAAEAEAAYRRALAVKAGFVPALFFLAQTLAQTGKVTEAETSLRAACKADPHHGPSRELLARILAGKRSFDEALSILREAMAQGATPRLHVVYGEVSDMAGKTSDAQAAYEDALRMDPDAIDALWREAELLLRVHEYDKARPVLERYLQVGQKVGESAERMGQARQVLSQLAAQAGGASAAKTAEGPAPRTAEAPAPKAVGAKGK